MKKLLIIFAINLIGFFTIAQTPVIAGKYKFKLTIENLYMELNYDKYIRAGEGCNTISQTCGNQAWQITPVRGKADMYRILLVGTGKYLTWNDVPEVQLSLSLQTQYPIAKAKYQSFTILPYDNGSIRIQPAIDGDASANDYYLAANLSYGVTNFINIIKKQGNANTKMAYYWKLETAATSSLVVQSPSVIIGSTTKPVNNKLDIDIKTGGDNLEPRTHQENPEISVEINGQPSIVVTNINKNQTWPNSSTHRITIPLPPSLNIQDVKSITIIRKTKYFGRDEMVSSDNWTISNITVVGYINNNRIPLANYTTTRPNNKVFRFMAMANKGDVEEGGEFNKLYGWGNQVKLNLSSEPTVVAVGATNNNNSALATMSAMFGTGGDDLRGGRDNINMLIRFKSGRLPISLNNLNASRNWRNFYEKTVEKVLPNSQDIAINDIKDVIIRHTGGGGIGADNWYLDKFKLTITKGTETKVLIDKIEAPIHYFTGDSRSKTLVVN